MATYTDNLQERKSPIIILGAGGHAKVLIEILNKNSMPILGIIDPNANSGDKFLNNRILGGDEIISEYKANEINLVNGVGSVPGNKKRANLAKKFREQGYRFVSVIDPNAVLASDVQLAEGVQIMAGVVIQPGVQIGKDTIVNTSVSIDHDCKIGENCHIAPGATLSGSVCVGDNTHIGTGTSVIQDINIGDECIIGAGSVIYKNINTGIKLINRRKEISGSEETR